MNESLLRVNCSDKELQSLVGSSGVKALQGGAIFFLNLAIVAVMLFHRLLRQQKEYVVLIGRAFCDTLRGSALIATGIGRIAMVQYGSGLFL